MAAHRLPTGTDRDILRPIHYQDHLSIQNGFSGPRNLHRKSLNNALFWKWPLVYIQLTLYCSHGILSFVFYQTISM